MLAHHGAVRARAWCLVEIHEPQVMTSWSWLLTGSPVGRDNWFLICPTNAVLGHEIDVSQARSQLQAASAAPSTDDDELAAQLARAEVCLAPSGSLHPAWCAANEPRPPASRPADEGGDGWSGSG